MTQKPDTNSVMGDFNHAGFTNYATGYSFRMTTESNQFFITVEPPVNVDRSRHPYPKQTFYLKWPVSLLTGSHHMQGYWVPQGKGRTMSLAPIMYLKEDQRWISRSSAFLEPPGRRHLFEDASWNRICIQCHATDGHTSSAAGGGLESTVTEFGISCEACHGPGERHVRLRRAAADSGAQVADDPIVNPRTLGHERSSQVCGACHGRTWLKDASKPRLYKPGGDLLVNRHLLGDEPEVKAAINEHLKNHSMPDGVTNAAGLLKTFFWSDGLARVSSSEYNGMVASPCYQRGEMSCFSCHRLHQAKSDHRTPEVWADDQLRHDRLGDHSCTQCHQEPKYSTREHTHHPVGSPGSSCLNCHQPHTSYGLMKAIRSHTVSSPSVAKTLETGRPNACNLCHLDRSLGWSSQHLADWYGHPKSQLNEDQKVVSAAVLDALKGDASLRALTAWSMGWEPAVETSGSDWLVPYLALLMEDSYHAVRYIADRSLRKQKKYQDLAFDFLGEPGRRKQFVVALTENWMTERRLNHRDGAKPSVLVETNGLLDGAKFGRLRAARDHRRIVLNE
ncbi:MAG: multiheme c-type cytochrome [Limisphaerales bacterium]